MKCQMELISIYNCNKRKNLYAHLHTFTSHMGYKPKIEIKDKVYI